MSERGGRAGNAWDTYQQEDRQAFATYQEAVAAALAVYEKAEAAAMQKAVASH